MFPVIYFLVFLWFYVSVSPLAITHLFLVLSHVYNWKLKKKKKDVEKYMYFRRKITRINGSVKTLLVPNYIKIHHIHIDNIS